MREETQLINSLQGTRGVRRDIADQFIAGNQGCEEGDIANQLIAGNQGCEGGDTADQFIAGNQGCEETQLVNSLREPGV